MTPLDDFFNQFEPIVTEPSEMKIEMLDLIGAGCDLIRQGPAAPIINIAGFLAEHGRVVA